MSTDLEATVAAGNLFFREIMNIDTIKHGIARQDILFRINEVLQEFLSSVSIDFSFSIAFEDVHALMGFAWHTELAYVKLDEKRCDILFHDRLISFSESNSGFIFIGKLWVFVVVVAELVKERRGWTKNFVFEIGDGASLNQPCFTSTHPEAVTIVDFEFAKTNGYSDFRQQPLIPWLTKTERLFWRGSTTGVRLSEPPAPGSNDDFSWLQRLQACIVITHSKYAADTDVGITNIAQIREDYLVDRINASGLIKNRTPREYFRSFKYLLDIDGNANAWSGLFCSLLGASCVFKVASPSGHHQWYYDQMRPWRDYIPLDRQLSDFDECFEWALCHDRQTEEIALRGYELASSIDMRTAVRQSVWSLARWLDHGHASGIKPKA